MNTQRQELYIGTDEDYAELNSRNLESKVKESIDYLMANWDLASDFDAYTLRVFRSSLWKVLELMNVTKGDKYVVFLYAKRCREKIAA